MLRSSILLRFHIFLQRILSYLRCLNSNSLLYMLDKKTDLLMKCNCLQGTRFEMWLLLMEHNNQYWLMFELRPSNMYLLCIGSGRFLLWMSRLSNNSLMKLMSQCLSLLDSNNHRRRRRWLLLM